MSVSTSDAAPSVEFLNEAADDPQPFDADTFVESLFVCFECDTIPP
jgi:hypothetical protein